MLRPIGRLAPRRSIVCCPRNTRPAPQLCPPETLQAVAGTPPVPAYCAMDLARVRGASLFEGEWKDGRPYRGSGKYVSKDGRTCFDGFFRKGAPYQGSGTWVDGAGNSFTGTIDDAWPVSGEGRIVCSGNVYDGDWERGTGQGTIVQLGVLPGGSASGAKEAEEWRGEFVAVNASLEPEQRPVRGSGVFVSHEGLRCKGLWSNGEVVRGEGSWRSSGTGFLFAGEFLGSGQGKGTIVTLSSHGRELVFEGEWRGSLPYVGKGEIAVDGTTFRGEWKEGNRFYHGKKYETISDIGPALQRHMDKQAAAKAESLSTLRSKSLRAVKALPSMDAVASGSLERGEEKRAAQRAARRERRKERTGKSAPAAKTETDRQAETASNSTDGTKPATTAPVSKALPTLPPSAGSSAGRISPAAAAAAAAAAPADDDLYRTRKLSDEPDDTGRRKMVDKLVSGSNRRREAKQQVKGEKQLLTPLERAMEAAAADAKKNPRRRTKGGKGASAAAADNKSGGRRKTHRPKSRSGDATSGGGGGGGSDGAAAASGVAAIEGWLKSAAEATGAKGK